MRRRRHESVHQRPARRAPSALAALFVLALAHVSAPAAPTAALGGYDIGALMESAERRYDISKLDAVVLLDERDVAVQEDGTVVSTMHSIVWFSTELGLDTYADLRVPYNTSTSELRVLALRTWRDGAWWPHETELSPTAVVETTPNACQGAYDYTTMRETMLLHDGVELPCIVETAYTVSERRDPALGSDRLWIIPNPDPTVRKVLSVTVPADVELHWTAAGAPQPQVMRSQEHGDTYRWVAEEVDRLPRPLTNDPVAHEPFVAWSTWRSWSDLGSTIAASIDRAAVLTDALADSVAAVTDGHSLARSRAEAVASFLAETTRGIDYDDSFWQLVPRSASRTWETAYGHRLDRAALAAALLREAGCDVTPLFRTTGRSAVDADVPALSWFGGIELGVRAAGLDAVFDPASCKLEQPGADDNGSTVWRVDEMTGPTAPHRPGPSVFELTLSLKPGDEQWTGSAELLTTGTLCARARMTGLSGETGRFLDEVASSVIGASGDEYGIAELGESRASAGFDISLDAPEQDHAGRVPLVIGDPAGGLLSHLPDDVHAYVARRDSPVMLPGPLSQTVTLRLDPGDLDVVRLPEPVTRTNELGSFSLRIEEKNDGTVVVSRSLTIGDEDDAAAAGSAGGVGYNGLMLRAEDWPLLRALLLEETDPRHRTLLLR